MSDQQARLIDSAKAKFGTIYPCRGQTEWDECFTRENGQVNFWFNTGDRSTHIEKEDKE